MQTFLPYPNFEQTAKCLDWRRLGKQRLEAKQILDILLNRTNKKGWRHHPCVAMWRGYELALQEYYNTILREWISRGYNNNMYFEFVTYHNDKDYAIRIRSDPREHPEFCLPPWLNEQFCASHRSNLLRKDSKWYGQFGWKEFNNLPYIWPHKEEQKWQ